VGSWVMVGGLGMMFGNLIYAFFRGKKAEANPWGGATLEWTLPSPPPLENWEHNPPLITHGPYVFNGTEAGNGKKSGGDGHESPAVTGGAGARKKGH
jgi:cytochrome c oxidase subunit 1